jgi:hypothetical protein
MLASPASFLLARCRDRLYVNERHPNVGHSKGAVKEKLRLLLRFSEKYSQLGYAWASGYAYWRTPKSVRRGP